MNFFLITLAAFAAVVSADVSHLDAAATILKQESDVGPEGYSYSYETSNGISGQESGQLKNAGAENAALDVQGSNQYTAPDGTVIQLTYQANENGYQPQGAHLPVGPEIPPAILKALEYIRAHPPKEQN